MKSVVIFILAFLVATAGSAAVKVMLTKPAPASASDSTAKAKDSTQTPTDTAIVASAGFGARGGGGTPQAGHHGRHRSRGFVKTRHRGERPDPRRHSDSYLDRRRAREPPSESTRQPGWPRGGGE